MKPYATFRSRPLGRVVAPKNEDRQPAEIVPFGRFGAGELTGHPIGLVIVFGVLLLGLIGIPAWRLFFAATVFVGSLVGFFLWRYHQPK